MIGQVAELASNIGGGQWSPWHINR